VADPSGPFRHARVINAGKQQGVKKGQAAVDGEGLIGRVVSVGNNSARILLLPDLDSRIPVAVEPSGTNAILVGNDSAQPRLEHLPPLASINVGDRVVTSGAGGDIAPGIPVGTVTGEPGDFRVALFADFHRAEYVRLLQYNFPRDVDLPEGAALISEGTGSGTADAANAPPSLQ
jgi:rod shape-determining protein MreC